MRTLFLIFIFLFSLTVEGQVHVKGYTKSNGTYVEPYTRSSPNSSPYDNYSYPGNTNPYTGKTATGNSDTYIKNLYDNNSTPSTSDVWIDSYYRKDGTYVTGHWRSSPNGNPYDNYSFPGNTNPYTGKTATGTPETYLKNYYDNSSNNYLTTYYVSSNTLNIRSGPSAKYSVLTSLTYGSEIEVLGTANPNWTKVRISYFDSYSYKTATGYVYSNYISTSNPMTSNSSYNSNNDDLEKLFSNSNISTSSYNNSTSTYNSSSSYQPFGYNNGKITMWTDCSDNGQISVYIDDVYKGKITSFFKNNYTPNCGDSGTLSIILAKGTYKVTASGNKKSWEGYVTVMSNECSLKQLSR